MMVRSLLTFALLFAVACSAAAQEKKQPQPDTPIDVGPVRAFPSLRLRRPVLFTNAGDGTNRIFVGVQQGVIQVFPNDDAITEEGVKTFLDWESHTVYKDKENEEGFLGLAFHPKYKENGEFFIYYNTTEKEHTTVVSRFKVSKDDPNKADPKSEQELFRVTHPFWNHKGGTMCFGPDGYLYITLGDGGSANDPMKNGQNMNTFLGKILRIDVDHHDEGKNYAIPKDNPFVGKKDVKPEIWAYGFRNVWRMSFDRETGHLWAADVGQDLWEEIDIVVKGGNYGWNLREAMHKFKDGSEKSKDLIDPIWEYHHDIGKSITGGYVYRGKKVPQLTGCYLYADYVSGRQWALKYDEKAQKVVANYALKDPENKKSPIITYGEDEQGEVYCTDVFGMVYRYAEVKK
jgi:quinoprotein glucose dehydrogenase